MSRPVVSVIIPCRNYGRFLAETLESALSQTLQDIEILLFNDDSTDDTDQVARAYSSDRRITYIRQARLGLSRTRNNGIKRAGGRYIQLLDADDVLYPEKLELQSRLLDGAPDTAATYGPHIAIDESGRVIDDPIPWRPIAAENPLEDLISRWDHDLHIPPVCFMFRRVDLGGLQFDESVPTHEEWDFYIELLARGHRFFATSEPLAAYRRHSGSLSTDVPRMEDGRRLVLEKFVRRGGPAGAYARRRLNHQSASPC